MGATTRSSWAGWSMAASPATPGRCCSIAASTTAWPTGSRSPGAVTGNPRPSDLAKHNAAAFQLEDVVDRYHLRTPYPSTLAPFLRDLAVPRGGPVLELGCGTG